MANVNSSIGYVSLPAQNITNATEVVLTVPAIVGGGPGNGTYPSPAFPAGGPFYLQPFPDAQNFNSNATSSSSGWVNSLVDGRQFKIRVVGLATLAASSTLTLSLYYGSSATVANNTKVATVTTAALAAGTSNFVLESNFLWDSTSQKLNGWFWSDVNNVYTAAAANTAVTSVTASSLYFIPSFTYAAGNAGNSVTVREFLSETV